MDTQISRESDKLTFFLIGDLDETCSSRVDIEFTKLLEEDSNIIYLDLSKVNYISSVGIGVLMLSYKKAIKCGKKINIVNLSKKAGEILGVVGILHLFK